MTDTRAANFLKAGQWSAMPTWFIERGLLAALTRASTARVYIAMVSAANWGEQGLVKRSVAALGADAGVHEKSVRRAVPELVNLGLIERVTRGGGRHGDVAEYRIIAHVERHQNRTLLSASHENRTSGSGSEPDILTTRTGHLDHQNRTFRPPEPDTACPLLQKTEDRRTEKKGRVVLKDPCAMAEAEMRTDTLRTEAFRAAWMEWAAYRREMGKKLTPATIKRQVHKLEDFGHDRAIASIDQSILNGWAGLFEPRGLGATQHDSSHESADPKQIGDVVERIMARRAKRAGRAELEHQSREVF